MDERSRPIKAARTNRRVTSYALVFVGLGLGFAFLRNSTWQGTTELHTVMEVIASLLAAFVGAMALVRFYSRKNSTFLFIGTALLDGYHAVVTSTYFDQLFPSVPESLIPWSWVASRIFLSVLLVISWLAWRWEEHHGRAGRISEWTVFGIVAVLTITSFLFFVFVPLPRAYYPELFFHRPEEFAASLFFLFALIGYLQKGRWRDDAFEHWLVLSIIVAWLGRRCSCPYPVRYST